jgi:hypothetical protein
MTINTLPDSSAHAILLGWASELPVLVQMNALLEQHRPKLEDPDFWAVWSGQDSEGQTVERPLDWKTIADDWQQIGAPVQEQYLERDDG